MLEGRGDCDEWEGLLAEEEGRLKAEPRGGLDLPLDAETGTVCVCRWD
jgi:hypothetical protein